MMTMDDDLRSQSFSGVPDDMRDSVIERAGRAAPSRRHSTPAPNPKLTYAEPQNCVLHFIAPAHEVRPSFATVIGLSLCAQCVLEVSDALVDGGFSAKEFIADALAGEWITE